MRAVVKNREFYEGGKIVQERTLYDDVEKRYYHERYENGRKVSRFLAQTIL